MALTTWNDVNGGVKVIELWRALAFGAVCLLVGVLSSHWREVMAIDEPETDHVVEQISAGGRNQH